MYAVRGIEIAASVVDVVKHSLNLHITLYDKALNTVVEQIIEPANWYLMLYGLDGGGIVSITRGSVIKVNTPLAGYRMCPGELAVSISSNAKEGVTYIYKASELCTRRAVDHFCPLHRGSTYSRYLMYVYGLRGLPPDTGLAPIPHMVYALYIGGQELKVGIASAIKNVNRVYEQVFIYASIATFTDNVVSARNIEKTLSEAGVRDRVAITERVDWLKKVSSFGIDTYLRSFATVFLRRVAPVLQSLGISTKTFIPVIRFSDKCFEIVRNSVALCNRSALNSLEGRAIVEDYCAGGILLRAGHGKSYYVPYQLIRDRVLNIDVVR